MAAVMTKRGTQDNVATYEHVCDTTADMATINPQYINLGSICLVINGESGGLEVYIADSNKQWSAISAAAGGGGGGEGGGLSIHICSANEYDSVTKTPTITVPAADIIYLVPTSSTTGDLFSEWIYVDSAWERIGGTSIDLSQYVRRADYEHGQYISGPHVIQLIPKNGGAYQINTDYDLLTLGEYYEFATRDSNPLISVQIQLQENNRINLPLVKYFNRNPSYASSTVELIFAGTYFNGESYELIVITIRGNADAYDPIDITINTYTQTFKSIQNAFLFIDLIYDESTDTYSWNYTYNHDNVIQDLGTICDVIHYTNELNFNIYARVFQDTSDYTTNGKLFPLISADWDGRQDPVQCSVVFGITRFNDNRNLIFESFTLEGPAWNAASQATVTHSITPIASSAGSFAAAEELSDVATNLKSLVQEIAYTTSSSHAAATIASIDTLLTALDAMKPQPTYTANVIYENFTNNATRFSTDNIPINFANGDYVEALIDVTTCSQDQENILSVGTSIDSFDAAVAYLFYWRNNQIHVRLKDVEASIAVDRYVEANDYSAVLIRIDSTGVYIDGTLVPGMTGDNVTHLNSASTYKIGCRMSKLNTATYDHITVYNKN